MYAKLMSRITESSLMEEDVIVRYAFMMLLAIADPKGYVIGTDVAIARRLNIPLETLKECIAELGKPDPDSNSQELDGRRVIPSDCERGYFVVNYQKYRDTRDEEQRREYMRDYMRKRRNGKDVTALTPRKPRKRSLANAEAEADTEAEPPNPQRGNVGKNVPKTEVALRMAAIFNRRATTGWGEKEVKAFKSLGIIDTEELAAVELYYSENAGKPDSYCRRDLQTFLNNYRGEVDRAKAWLSKNIRSAKPASATEHPRWREFLQTLGRPYVEHQFAPEHIRDDFADWKKKAAAA